MIAPGNSLLFLNFYLYPVYTVDTKSQILVPRKSAFYFFQTSYRKNRIGTLLCARNENESPFPRRADPTNLLHVPPCRIILSLCFPSHHIFSTTHVDCEWQRGRNEWRSPGHIPKPEQYSGSNIFRLIHRWGTYIWYMIVSFLSNHDWHLSNKSLTLHLYYLCHDLHEIVVVVIVYEGGKSNGCNSS